MSWCNIRFVEAVQLIFIVQQDIHEEYRSSVCSEIGIFAQIRNASLLSILINKQRGTGNCTHNAEPNDLLSTFCDPFPYTNTNTNIFIETKDHYNH